MSDRISPDGETYYPTPEVVAQARVKDWDALARTALADPQAFWAAEAGELEWYRKWDKVLDDSKKPFYKWFAGAQCNIVHNALDRHQKSWRKNKLSLVWVGERNEVRTYSYFALNRDVCKFANVLKAMGVKKGDRVTIYMPRVPEIVIAMLACAKIGAIHSVVYGGFSVDALQGRIEDSESKVVITADGGFMNGKVVELKKIVDDAVRHAPTVETVIVVQRTGHEVRMEAGRDYWYHDLMKLPLATGVSATEVMDAYDPLYMLYTSGTTGKPKGLIHCHGGYMVGVYSTLKYVFDLKDEDRYWCAADPGWVTGHSYIVYGPLLMGATTFMYEGAPTYPYPNRWWHLVEKYGITILYTAPTAIRGLMRFGESWPNRHDLSTLRILGSVGEPINPEAWKWYHRVIGKGRCPIMDTWWQTETGMFQITPTPVVPLKPGSATRPFFGQDAEILDEDGKSVPDGEEGYLVAQEPVAGRSHHHLQGPRALREPVLDQVPGEVHGRRFGQAGQGRILLGHRPHRRRHQGLGLPAGHRRGGERAPEPPGRGRGGRHRPFTRGEGAGHLRLLHPPQGLQGERGAGRRGEGPRRQAHGPIVRPEKVTFVDSLPKTRSGKIMRRVLKARAQGLPDGDISTMED